VPVASCAFRTEDSMRYLNSYVCPARGSTSYCSSRICWSWAQHMEADGGSDI